ncbi:MAG: hypothetical protein IT291_07735 [Deltaproteobacteria bacterium]|nr:hypothetical protein [Deltaproteobacteria bacterium]
MDKKDDLYTSSLLSFDEPETKEETKVDNKASKETSETKNAPINIPIQIDEHNKSNVKNNETASTSPSEATEGNEAKSNGEIIDKKREEEILKKAFDKPLNFDSHTLNARHLRERGQESQDDEEDTNPKSDWPILVFAAVLVIVIVACGIFIARGMFTKPDKDKELDIEKLIKTQQSILAKPSAEKVAEDEATMARAEERLDIPSGKWMGELKENEITINTTANSSADNIKITFQIAAEETAKLTPMEIVQKKKRAPWLARFENDALLIEIPANAPSNNKPLPSFPFNTSANGRAYLKDDAGALRLPATIDVEGVVDIQAKEIRGKWKIAQEGGNKEDNLNNFARRKDNVTFEFFYQGKFLAQFKEGPQENPDTQAQADERSESEKIQSK